ncbi:Hypothetical protein A7982_01695 [Minicystis rosea]|nr:Hypothetical protein A7982_01695 [Minicystis rosea]
MTAASASIHLALSLALGVPLLGCRTSHADDDHQAEVGRVEVTAETSRATTNGALPADEAPPLAAPKPACPSGTQPIPGGKLQTLERGRDVDVTAFCLDEHEVTVAEFRACVQSGACKRECANGADCPAVPRSTEWSPDEDTKVSRFCNGRASDRDDHPVNCVSIGEAEAYCAAHDKRLPTGDEWEWASRGGPSRTPSPWGTAVATNQICWGKPYKRAGTCNPTQFPTDKTPQGIYGMGGNLTEWTRKPARDRTHADMRWAYGASWYAIDDGYARAALGGVQMPAKRAETVGFRCARDLTR